MTESDRVYMIEMLLYGSAFEILVHRTDERSGGANHPPLSVRFLLVDFYTVVLRIYRRCFGEKPIRKHGHVLPYTVRADFSSPMMCSASYCSFALSYCHAAFFFDFSIAVFFVCFARI